MLWVEMLEFGVEDDLLDGEEFGGKFLLIGGFLKLEFILLFPEFL